MFGMIKTHKTVWKMRFIANERILTKKWKNFIQITLASRPCLDYLLASRVSYKTSNAINILRIDENASLDLKFKTVI